MPLDQLVSPPLSDLHSLRLACNFTTLQTLATLTRTTPDFLLAHTVASRTSQERLQWLTIWQTEPSWMLPYYEFRFQLTTNYCESCLLEDANTTGFEFFPLHWLLAPQTICPRHLTFLSERCRCCNRHLQPRHWRSKTKFVLACAWTKKPLAQEPREHRDRPEQVHRCLASFEQSLLAAIRGQTTDGTWFGGQSAPDILRVICDLLCLLTRAVGNDSYIQHCLEGSHFRPHCRWERPPKAKPWLGDLRIHDRRSVLATLALLLDSGVNRKILHDPRRLLMPGIRTLDRLLALQDQQELRQRLDLWHPAFRSLASNLLTGLQSTRY
jgi:TniQ